MSSDDLDNLTRRIAKVNPKSAQKQTSGVVQVQSWAIGYRMISDLFAGIVVGLIMGWGLDKFLGTKPWLMIVFCLLGFVAGARTMMQSAKQLNKKSD